MKQLNPYIGFAGKCKEAMNFYKDCLGGELDFMTVGGSPIEAQCPAGMKDQILHSTLTNDKIVIMGTDMAGPGGITQGNNVAICLTCSSEEEINELFTKMSEGGKIHDPLKMQFFGALFGVLNDKFGTPWMMFYEPKK